MQQLIDCPNCRRPLFNVADGTCLGCGVRGTASERIDATALAGLLHNVKLRLTELGLDGFQQILGVLGPRPGHGAEDGVPFTDETCGLVHRYMLAHGVRCVRIDITANNTTNLSLVVAQTEYGIARGVRVARKLALQKRAIMEIKYAA